MVDSKWQFDKRPNQTKRMLSITDNELSDLETIIDSRGLPLLLDAIASICRAKSEHCAANWQDETLARVWDARADIVANIVPTIQNQSL